MILINCIAVDDEPPSLRQMEEYISKVPYLNLLATFDNAIDSMNYLKDNPVDLVFLDIQMENLSGIQFLKLLKDKPQIILTTAYDSYALEAFDLDVDDYLLKPISFERFLKSTEKIHKKAIIEKHSDLAVATELSEKREYFFVKTEFHVERVDFSDILYIEGLKEYLGINTANRKILTLQSFNDILDTLPSSNFIRTHKSYVVAVNKITRIERSHIFIGDKLIPIGPKYKDDFFNTLKSRKLI